MKSEFRIPNSTSSPATYGLPYTRKDFEDVNQSFGVGQP